MTTLDQRSTPAFAPFAYLIVFNLAWIAWLLFVYPRLMAIGNDPSRTPSSTSDCAC